MFYKDCLGMLVNQSTTTSCVMRILTVVCMLIFSCSTMCSAYVYSVPTELFSLSGIDLSYSNKNTVVLEVLTVLSHCLKVFM